MTERRSTGRRHGETIATVAFEDAFVALTDGILITDASDTILSANPAAFRLLGEDQLIGRSFGTLLLVSGATTVPQPEGHEIQRAWFPREERMGVLEIVTTPVSGSDPPTKIRTVRDVTASAELLRLKEDFLLDVAHELRTPIAGLTASLDLLNQDVMSMSRQELRKMVATLGRSALRLEHLVQNLLDAGSIEAGTFEVRAVPTSVRAVLEESLAFVRPILEQKNQELVTRFGRASDRVVADPRRTAQVFSNLLANAVKYAPEATAITITTASDSGYVRVTIHNAGPAIADDEVGRLFQRFFRSRTVRAESGGLGLGLAICRAIVRAQGGEIGLESAPGAGTSVHFTLPKARVLAAEEVTA
ncbi:MAG TPA: PAS domain-containing sensor histidine kinase [Candidatus Limnocylindria bacterium]